MPATMSAIASKRQKAAPRGGCQGASVSERRRSAGRRLQASMARLWLLSTAAPKEKYAGTPRARRSAPSRAVPEYEWRMTAGRRARRLA